MQNIKQMRSRIPKVLRELILSFLAECQLCYGRHVVDDGFYINGRFCCTKCVMHAGTFMLKSRFAPNFITMPLMGVVELLEHSDSEN